MGKVSLSFNGFVLWGKGGEGYGFNGAYFAKMLISSFPVSPEA